MRVSEDPRFGVELKAAVDALQSLTREWLRRRRGKRAAQEGAR